MEMYKDILGEILDYWKAEEQLKAQQKVHDAIKLKQQADVKSRSEQVLNLTIQIKQLEIEHLRFKAQFIKLPETARQKAQIQMLELERELFLTPIRKLKNHKKSKS